MQPVPLISYQDLISITLTALAVMLTVLGIGIAVLAFMGYAGLKDFVRELAEKQVAQKLKEYPEPAEFMEQMRKEMSAQPFDLRTEEETDTGPAVPIKPYPGEEANKTKC